MYIEILCVLCSIFYGDVCFHLVFFHLLSVSLNDNLAPAVRCFPLICTNLFFITGFAKMTLSTTSLHVGLLITFNNDLHSKFFAE